MLDFVTGPVAKNTFGTDANAKLGNPNAAQAVATMFKAPRPLGLGMRCAPLDVDSYVQVDVTKRLRLCRRWTRTASWSRGRRAAVRADPDPGPLMESGSRSTGPPAAGPSAAPATVLHGGAAHPAEGSLTIGRLADNDLPIAEGVGLPPPRPHRGRAGRILDRRPRLAQRHAG